MSIRINYRSKLPLLALSMHWLLSACQAEQFPDQFILTVSPPQRTILVDGNNDTPDRHCLQNDFPYLDVPVLVAVNDQQGSPIGGMPVSVYTDWTGNSTGFDGIVEVLYDSNGDGVVDAETEIVSSSSDAIFNHDTDQYTGSIALTLRLNLSCQYRGEIVALAGGKFAATTFSVEQTNEPEPEPASVTQQSIFSAKG